MPHESCKTCNDSRWVCEGHQHRPWGDLCCDERPDGLLRRLWFRFGWRVVPQAVILRMPNPERLCSHGACHCGGAGDPCPGCNPEGEIDPGWSHIEADVAVTDGR